MSEEQTTLFKESTTDESLLALIRLSKSAQALNEEIEAAEKALKEKKDTLTSLTQKTIPDLMLTLGIEHLSLTGGDEIQLTTIYTGSASKDRMPEIAEWLKSQNADGIIDREYRIMENLVEQVRAAGFPVNEDMSIHHSRLKAFIREQMETNQEFPVHLFKAQALKHAKIVTK